MVRSARAAEWIVIPLGVLALFIVISFCSSAQAQYPGGGYPGGGSYDVTYSGGTYTQNSSGPPPYTYTYGDFLSYYDNIYEGVGHLGFYTDYQGLTQSASISCDGVLTATLTWNNGGDPTNLPPKSVVVREDCTAWWTGSANSGSTYDGTCDNPLGGQSVPGYGGHGQTWTFSRYLVKTGPGASFTVTCAPTASAWGVSGSTPGGYGDCGAGVNFTAAIVPASQFPGGKRTPTPGKDIHGQDPPQPVVCNGGGGEGSVSGQIDQKTGNVLLQVADPTPTRGYPLVCNISLNSQAVETNRPMGNATFTDDIHVTSDTVYDQSGNSSIHWMLVDGDGTRLDFGLTSSAPTATAGIFSHLATTVTGGYEVTGAGPPEAIHEAGNYAYLFNSSGQMTQITDPNGNVQTLTYTGGQLTQATDQSTGKSLSFTYTGSLITQVTENGGGTVTTLAYSGSSLTDVTVKDGSGNTLRSVQYGYDATSGLLTSVQRDGNAATQVNFHYDYMPATDGSSTGVPMAVKAAGNDATDWGNTPDAGASDTVVQSFDGGAATAVHYNSDSSGNLTQTVGPAFAGASQANTQNTVYNANRQATSVSDGAVTEQFGYTTNGLLNSYTDGLNNTWASTFNGTDLTSAQDPVQAAAGVSETLTYGDPSQPHVPTAFTDAEGNAWGFGHNAHGQTTSVTPPLGSPTGATTYTYDETPASATLGYLLSETDGNGDTVTYDAFDALGDVLAVSTYPDTGNPAVKNTTQFAYDAAQRLTQITAPDGKTFGFHYTGSNLDSTTDEAGTQYSYTYCASCGLMTGVSGPLGWSLGWARDADHKMTAFTDANSHQTLYSYGNAQELTGVAYPDGSGFSFLYTDQGQVRQVTNGRGHQISLGYDGAGRLHQAAFPTSGEPTITANYDAAGRVSGFTDGVGNTSYTYLLNGSLSKVVYDYSASGLANAQELDYAYNADGTLASLTWKNGTTTVGTWSYGYDAGGRLTTLTNPFSETTTWTYDGEGKLTGQFNANGTSTVYAYNQQRGWPTSITHYSGSTAFASYALTYDNGGNTVGNLTGVAEADGSTVSYGYDALYRLTGEQRTGTAPGGHSFGYDLAGNLTSLDSGTATYDSANKITNSGFSYDGDGNLTGDSMATYVRDDWGDLASRAAGGVTTAYGYDARGLRIVSQVGLGIKTFYVYDDDILLGEINGAGVVQSAYTWGVDGLVSERLVGQNRSLWYHFGPQGETRQLTDGTGAVTDSYVYSAYGQPIASAGTDSNPFRYGGAYGYYTDAAATGGAVLCTHRWYDPNTARWLTRDPVGYEGGDNLYAYCNNNPVKWIDPEGFAPRRGPGVKAGPGKSKYATDMNERPRPDMHIWHHEGETVVTAKGGWVRGVHKGATLRPLPANLRAGYRPIIRDFTKKALKYLETPPELEWLNWVPVFDYQEVQKSIWEKKHPGLSYDNCFGA